MNFHISPLSPLRPRYPTTTLGPSSAARSPGPSEHHHRHHHHHHHHQQREPDDDDQDDGTDHYHLHLRPPHTPVGRAPNPLLGRPRIELDDELLTSTSESNTGSSGLSDSDPDPDPPASPDRLAQDSRDVLVQRLDDLARRLGAADVRAGDVEALHARVDEMERVLSGGGGGAAGGRRAARGTSLMGPPLSPSWLLSQLQRQPSAPSRGGGEVQGRASGPPAYLHPSSVEQPGPLAAAAAAAAAATAAGSSSRESYEMADTIVQEAEGLCAEMASVIASLQKRREESDHLHAVLVQREGAAGRHVLEQAARIGELEGAAAEDESELRYLRIQLRGIEAQCLGYIPEGADPELDQSIRSWKEDWTSLRDRWAARKGSSFVSGDESGTFSSSTSPAAL